MPLHDYGEGATPGVPRTPLTPEPLGTRGELTPGPDDLDPDIPEERDELRRLGYDVERPDDIEDMGVMDDGPPDRELPFGTAPATGSILPNLGNHPMFD